MIRNAPLSVKYRYQNQINIDNHKKSRPDMFLSGLNIKFNFNSNSGCD